MQLKYRRVDDFPYDLTELSKGKNTWIEVSSTNLDLIRDVLMHFDVHPLVIDDIRTLEQRMKISVFDDDIYLLLNLLYLNESTHVLEQQQMSFCLLENILITVQEYAAHSIFSTIKHRLAKQTTPTKGRLKNMKIDYLFYSLLNVVIENYVAVLDSILHEMERIDKELMFSTKTKISTLSVKTLKLMFHIKHDLFHFKIVCAPLKDIVIKLQKTREALIPKRQRPALRQCRRRLKRRLRQALCQTRPSIAYPTPAQGDEEDQYLLDNGILVLNDYIYKYFRRLLDHIVQLNDTIDSYTDIITSLIDFYMILNGDLINNTIQTLTTVSCIFMPLNFFSSLSSMNFEHMPQIPMRFGYFIQMAVIGFLGFLMILSFKWKRLL